MKNFLFTLKKKFMKFSTIYRESLKFSLQNHIFKMFLFISELFAS